MKLGRHRDLPTWFLITLYAIVSLGARAHHGFTLFTGPTQCAHGGFCESSGNGSGSADDEQKTSPANRYGAWVADEICPLCEFQQKSQCFSWSFPWELAGPLSIRPLSLPSVILPAERPAAASAPRAPPFA